ncbi:hypothetical protein TIFTF001_014785 [Ficus carica]|uniref:Uncharacterized protein n=1 Tax=Ficus carica TaxID=3494 RepID=A0AA88D5Y1_FICCA|nr:hypothetical protein TIFTF001_014785 [Ficus carica]
MASAPATSSSATAAAAHIAICVSVLVGSRSVIWNSNNGEAVSVCDRDPKLPLNGEVVRWQYLVADRAPPARKSKIF